MHYGRFDGNSSADMLEKSKSDWIRRGKPARKNFNFQPTFARSLLYFHFWFASLASSNWSTEDACVVAES